MRDETAKDRFIRNHGENMRIIRGVAQRARQEGRNEDAAQIEDIADAWESIARMMELSNDQQDISR